MYYELQKNSIMKKLRIIVWKNSPLDSYLADSGFIFDNVFHLSDRTFYVISLTDKMDLINYLISKFSLHNYSIRCDYDDFIFHVRSF